MARKAPSEITQYKIRIREDLRLRLEAEARKRDVSTNYEIRARLERSFEREEMFKLDRVAANIAQGWAKWGDALFQLNRQDELAHATEKLIACVEQASNAPPETKSAIDEARKILTVIKGKRHD